MAYGQGGGIGALLTNGGFRPDNAVQGRQYGGLGDLAQSLLQQMMVRQQLGNAIDRRANPQGPVPAIGPIRGEGTPIGNHTPQQMFSMSASTQGTSPPSVGDEGFAQDRLSMGMDDGGGQYAQEALPMNMNEPTPEERRIERHMQEVAPDPQRQQQINSLMDEINYLMSQPDSQEKMDRIMTIEQQIEQLRSGQ